MAIELALGDEVQVRGRVVEISDVGCEPNGLRVTLVADLSDGLAVLHKFNSSVYIAWRGTVPAGDAA